MAESSTNIDQLAGALVKCQQQLKPALKDSTNPFFKSKYADLGAVWEACREALGANGLAVVQLPGFENGVAQLTTILVHISGQWVQGTAGAPLKTQDAQGVGSALTYLRRYGLAACVGVVTEDDDGEAASPKGKRGGASTPRGAVPKEPVAPTPQPLTEKPKQLTEEPAPWEPGEKLWPVGDKKGTALKDLPSADLVAALAWIKKTGRYEDFREPVEEVLASREGE